MTHIFLYYKSEVQALSQAILNETSDKQFQQRIEATLRRLEREQMNLLVVGEFSRGKSTFINAILEEPILPSKVNPTTATINIIKGGPTRSMRIKYWEGEDEVLSLPEEKVNKYLDTFVTTKNKDANRIKKIIIDIPGKIAQWQCVLVDTPGVNDLDDTREEVTYQYLSEADACIVLLDSQQPLSSSEQNFIRHKVLAKDINRLIFVINRMDEVDQDPDGENVRRIKAHVINLLKEQLPEIKEPPVFAVSSKATLKARHKDVSCVWRKSFEGFEEHLVSFIGKHASEGKLVGHIEQMIHIVEDQIVFVDYQKNMLGETRENIEEMIQEVAREEQQMGLKLSKIQLLLKSSQQDFCSHMRQVYSGEFEKIKYAMTEKLKDVETEKELQSIKTQLTISVRQVVEKISVEMEKQRDKLIGTVNWQLEDGNTSLPVVLSSWSTPKLNGNSLYLRAPMPAGMLYDSRPISTQTEQAMILLGGGSALAYIGGALFGPVGVVAGIAAMLFFGETINDYVYENKRRQEEERQKVYRVEQVIYQFDQMIELGKQNIENIVNEEISNIENYTKECIGEKRDKMLTFIQTRREQIHKEKNELKQIARSYELQIDKYRHYLNQLRELEGKMKNGC